MRKDLGSRGYNLSERMGKAGKVLKSTLQKADKAVEELLEPLRSPGHASSSLDAIMAIATREGTTLQALTDALNGEAVKTSARDHPGTCQRSVEKSLRQLEGQVAKALARGEHEVTLALIQTMHRIEREYKDDFLPLVKALGHKKAVELWRDRSSRLGGISEAQWQTLLDAAKGGPFSEALASIQAKNLRGRQERKERGPDPESPAASSSGAGPSAQTDREPHCLLCGKNGHSAVSCKAMPGLADRLGKAKRKPHDSEGQGRAKKFKGNKND